MDWIQWRALLNTAAVLWFRTRREFLDQLLAYQFLNKESLVVLVVGRGGGRGRRGVGTLRPRSVLLSAAAIPRCVNESPYLYDVRSVVHIQNDHPMQTDISVY